MKKRTSKSASATPATSSPSGTSAQTDGTASRRKRKPRGVGKFAFIVDRLNEMTTEEFRQSLIHAGILTPAGELAEKYQQAKKSAKRKKAGGKKP